MTAMTPGLLIPLIAGLGAPELLIIVGILVLLFGATKLPELARGSGRALRIFKAETKGLLDDDDKDATPEQREVNERNRAASEAEHKAQPECTARRGRHQAARLRLTPDPAAVSVGGVIELFRGRPRDPIGEGGRMSLGDHFRELRARVMRITLYLVLGTIIALFFYDFLFQLILDPYNEARRMLGQGTQTQAVITGVGTPLLLQLKLCGIAAIVATSPLWLHEIWGFVVPGLHRNERRWTRIFAITAGPLFIAGVALGYYVLPKGIAALIGFTPDGVTQLTEFGAFFSFITRMLLVFGIAFEIPLFLIMLNLAGIVSGKALGRHRPWIIIGTFVFAAVATPSTDPYSMLMLAMPMLLLVVISEVIVRLLDRRRGRNAAEEYDDDVASPL